MYTTWQNDYSKLNAFAEYAWNHAPYIYHTPLLKKDVGKDLAISFKISGDYLDTNWYFSYPNLYYRTSPTDNFTRMEIQLADKSDTTVTIPATKDKEWVQYYITAVDNRNFHTKIPFGDSVYFEIGTSSNLAVSNDLSKSSDIIIYPNPLETGETATIEFKSYTVTDFKLKISDIFGRKIFEKNFQNMYDVSSKIPIKSSNLAVGVYIVNIKMVDRILTKKLIVR
jgi:hypothetical protein